MSKIDLNELPLIALQEELDDLYADFRVLHKRRNDIIKVQAKCDALTEEYPNNEDLRDKSFKLFQALNSVTDDLKQVTQRILKIRNRIDVIEREKRISEYLNTPENRELSAALDSAFSELRGDD